jgi:hypothetical protein
MVAAVLYVAVNNKLEQNPRLASALKLLIVT